MEISTNLNKLNGSSVDDNNDDTEGNFESQSSGTDQKKDFSSKINLSENQQMSASYPSPNSPREMLMPGTTNSNSSLANSERRCLSQEIFG